ncbi:MAG: hypothetical protein AB1651_14450 [Pseudomonadota bacterium]
MPESFDRDTCRRGRRSLGRDEQFVTARTERDRFDLWVVGQRVDLRCVLEGIGPALAVAARVDVGLRQRDDRRAPCRRVEVHRRHPVDAFGILGSVGRARDVDFAERLGGHEQAGRVQRQTVQMRHGVALAEQVDHALAGVDRDRLAVAGAVRIADDRRLQRPGLGGRIAIVERRLVDDVEPHR